MTEGNVVGAVEPTGPKKIAIVGSSPMNWFHAPFEDPSWQIWGLSRLWQDPRMTRYDVWFELHRMEDLCKSWSANGNEAEEAAQRQVYQKWLSEQERPIYLRQEIPQIPSGIRYPIEKVCEVFPRKYFTNTVSYMIALAICMDPDVIGLWGVDMAQRLEYREQRPSCEYFLGVAEGRGIEVYLPPECNLLSSGRMYALEDPSPLEAAVKAKRREMEAKRNHLANQMQAERQAMAELTGALNVLDWLGYNYDYGGEDEG